ncbi:hypothetical protein E2C01_053866 [Portunus trituberculatus]|uniref:Uncharacterized protein n=1 Tax=Portunus trituberculatus TaxID=210409 RepID=A0A5B7GRZ4_PORTR|nr:hypothetical protein [Portunus trituberculatus]
MAVSPTRGAPLAQECICKKEYNSNNGAPGPRCGGKKAPRITISGTPPSQANAIFLHLCRPFSFLPSLTTFLDPNFPQFPPPASLSSPQLERAFWVSERYRKISSLKY